MRTTVAIPMFRSRRWIDVVAGNIERLAPHALVMVSDATGDDDSFDQLRRRYQHLPGTTWLGPRAIEPGWVAHCNDLLARGASEFFMWLPHDDEIDAMWISQAEAALDATPSAVLALGPIRSLEPGGRDAPSRVSVAPHAPFSSDDVSERLREGLKSCVTGKRRLLGAAFRGVVRRDRDVALPITAGGGVQADVFWALRMLARGSFANIPSVYWKRFYADSTFRSWDARFLNELRTRILPEALGDLTPQDRECLLTAAWTAEVEELRRQKDAFRAEVESSSSWRITAPLRALRRLSRRLRR